HRSTKYVCHPERSEGSAVIVIPSETPLRFGEGHEFQRLRKNSAPLWFREGHEFHSCRKDRPSTAASSRWGNATPSNEFLPRLF
ncbi:MAG: hypothetical protein WAM89_01920, partial [Terriglobales bacterium]